MTGGERAKAVGILEAVRTLKLLEAEQRSPTEPERGLLQQFSGFGPVALHLFPNPVTRQYRDAGWEGLGRQLEELLTAEEYASARRTTFNAFYTSPVVINAIHQAVNRLGVPENGLVLEPGCGTGNFIGHAEGAKRFIGVELDSLSARIAKALYPQHDIRQENFRETQLAEGSLDAVVGNVPFADVKLDYRGTKYSLHDYFFAKSVDALRPGGVLALVTSHFTLDKQNAAIRDYLAERADFVGAIRLPSDAFKHEGTAVVTDIVFLRKRGAEEPARHVDSDWLQTGTLSIDGAEVAVNRYFLNHPEMVLGTWSRKDTLYGGDGFSVVSHGDLRQQLQEATKRLPQFSPATPRTELKSPAPQFVPPPAEAHISVGSFFVGGDKAIYQSDGGSGVPVVYGGKALRADGTMTGRRMALLLELRDRARRVLQSQNDGWPEEHRHQSRRELNRSYDRFVAAYGPINRTTFSETKDGSLIRRMPNVVKFREDPDAMLVMSLEEYDEVTGEATKTDLMLRDVVGSHPPVTHVNSAEEGLLVSLNQQGCVNPEFIATLYGQPVETVLREL
ncbi:MAG: methyltransferase domain-containing protein, partial [Planctomycetaceae bacterium]|nr:methyltransferase domain-containing protein [Planctomycetaceae bacterium]